MSQQAANILVDTDETRAFQPSRYENNWRWWVLGTLFLATFLNYFDRQTLGTAIDPISEEFGLDNAQRGQLLSAFVFTYAFTHLFIGLIIDRISNIRSFFPSWCWVGLSVPCW